MHKLFLLVMVSGSLCAMEKGTPPRKDLKASSSQVTDTGVASKIAGVWGFAKKTAARMAYDAPDIELDKQLIDGRFKRLINEDKKVVLNDGFQAMAEKLLESCETLERRTDRVTVIADYLIDDPELTKATPDTLLAAIAITKRLERASQALEEQFTRLLKQQTHDVTNALQPASADDK